MSRRVVLGKYGPGSSDYGLRISRSGFDAADASNSQKVNLANLLFDSEQDSGTLTLISKTILNSSSNNVATWTFSSGGLPEIPFLLYRYQFNGWSQWRTGACGGWNVSGTTIDTPYVNGAVHYSINNSRVRFYVGQRDGVSTTVQIRAAVFRVI